jgi:hypothetical protein
VCKWQQVAVTANNSTGMFQRIRHCHIAACSSLLLQGRMHQRRHRAIDSNLLLSMPLLLLLLSMLLPLLLLPLLSMLLPLLLLPLLLLLLLSSPLPVQVVPPHVLPAVCHIAGATANLQQHTTLSS